MEQRSYGLHLETKMSTVYILKHGSYTGGFRFGFFDVKKGFFVLAKKSRTCAESYKGTASRSMGINARAEKNLYLTETSKEVSLTAEVG